MIDLGLDTGSASLSDRFIVPPFSVLDTRQGYWQARRREWLRLGIRGELGRGEGAVQNYRLVGNGLEAFNPESQRPDGVVTGQYVKPGPARTGEDYSRNPRSATGNDPDVYRHRAKPGPARTFAQDLMRGEVTRRDQDAASNLTGAAKLPEWADTGMENMAPGTSIFDPVMCEIAYRWFCPEGGSVLDPFAGGSVRGIVASRLGHPYVGVDLSAAQLAANEQQASVIVRPSDPYPQWIHGDSAQVLPTLSEDAYDLVFSCPPYYDLEVYSDDPRDLSNMSWHDFLTGYEAIIEAAAIRLRKGRFAVIVVSEVRAPDGTYRGLVPRTIHAFERAGMRFYNEAILLNAAGSLPLRAAKQFEASRKLGRTHQNVLVFVKGSVERGWSYDREQLPDPQIGMFDMEGTADAAQNGHHAATATE